MGTVLTSVSSHSGTRVRSTLSAPWLEVYPSPGVLLRSGVSIESQRWFLVCGDTVETAPPPSLPSVSLVDTLYSHILGELSEDPVMWMAKMTIVSHKWYRFQVPGTNNTIPTFRRGANVAGLCTGGSSPGSIELEAASSLTEAVPHNKGVIEMRVCFDSMCDNFRRVDVLWCPPHPVGGKQTKEGKPFHIYKLKPLDTLQHGLAYCVV